MLISFLQLLFAILKMVKYDVFTFNPLPHEKLLIMSKRKCMIKSNHNHCLSWNFSFSYSKIFHLIFLHTPVILDSIFANHFVRLEQNLFQKQKGFWLLIPCGKNRPNFFFAFRQVLKKVLIQILLSKCLLYVLIKNMVNAKPSWNDRENRNV